MTKAHFHIALIFKPLMLFCATLILYLISCSSENNTETEYYATGEKKRELSYKNKMRDGVQRSWHKNGKLESTANFVNGDLHGISKDWDSAGKLTLIVYYTKGKSDSSTRYSDSTVHKTRYNRYYSITESFCKNKIIRRVLLHEPNSADSIHWIDTKYLKGVKIKEVTAYRNKLYRRVTWEGKDSTVRINLKNINE